MKVAIFCGPTLPADEIKSLLPDASLFPPAEQGDLEFAQRLGFEVIALIDGVHRRRLPVWHKEILQCLRRGSRILGSSSMGALRAVECEPWGAEPVGEVARWYSEGEIDADDEVCITHLDKAHGYRQTSLPLVNIRASLMAAQVDLSRQKEIIETAQDMFYPDRNWPALFAACECEEWEKKQILDCELDIKAADALHLCYYIQNIRSPKEPVSAEREICHSSEGYGRVFLDNDRKLWNGKKILRQHNMAHPKFRDHALNRALALEFCKLAGISEIAPVSDIGNSDDIGKQDIQRIRDEEATLARAREWYSNAGAGFQDVPKILDFMRVNGLYQEVKEKIL